jgi:hypothetical protein
MTMLKNRPIRRKEPGMTAGENRLARSNGAAGPSKPAVGCNWAANKWRLARHTAGFARARSWVANNQRRARAAPPPVAAGQASPIRSESHDSIPAPAQPADWRVLQAAPAVGNGTAIAHSDWWRVGRAEASGRLRSCATWTAGQQFGNCCHASGLRESMNWADTFPVSMRPAAWRVSDHRVWPRPAPWACLWDRLLA